MTGSNWTGRFPRTQREAFGFSVEPIHAGDKAVGNFAYFAAGVLFALFLMGVI